MGRFYQTARPVFVDDNIYLPPWELMQNAIMTHEKRTDELLAKSEVLEGATTNINHLNFQEENDRVAAIQDKYSKGIDEITNAIYENPLEYMKHLPKLKQLQNEMQQDKTSGDWYKIEQRHSAYKNWLEENKQLKEDNPTLFNMLNNHWYSDITSRAAKNPDATFKGQKGIDRPDLIKGYQDAFENIKASATEVSDGKYKIGNKWISESEVANIAWNTLKSDKNYQGYVNQMGNVLGLKGYTDDKGNPLSAFGLVDGNGDEITFDEYQKLGEEEKKNVRKVLNQESAFYSDLAAVAQTYSFTDESIEEDKYGLQGSKATLDSKLLQQRQAGQGKLDAAKAAYALRLEQQRANNRLALEAAKNAGDMELLERRYELMGERDRDNYKLDLQLAAAKGDKKSQETLDILTAKETIGVLANPKSNFEKDSETIKKYTKPIDTPGGGGTYFTASPGTTAYAALQRRNNANEFARKKMKNSTVTLQNGTKFDGQRYFDWLGNREHSEELSREFLEREMQIYSKPSWEQSNADRVAQGTRWTPSWLKSQFGKDWDAVYELGKRYEKERDNWYDRYNKNTKEYEGFNNEFTQVSLQPITDVEVNRAMAVEINNNPANFYMVDERGNTPKNSRGIMKKVKPSTQLYVTSANAHNEMGIKVNLDGKDYFVFPSNGNTAETNLMTNLSLLGVDTDSQYFQEMTNRISTGLLHDLSSAGKNTKGTKSIVTELNGREVSIELVGDEVHLRTPDQGINTPPLKSYSNMNTFVTNYFKIK